MKNLILMTATLLMAHQAMANLECVGSEGTRFLVKTEGLPDTMTIELKGQAVYRSVPVVTNSTSARTVIQSPAFRNRNGAPASFYMTIYQKNGKLLFQFNEQSYVPVVPNVNGECRHI